MLTAISQVESTLKTKPWLVLLFFGLLVIVLRWAAFYQSVLTWDESLYILVAKGWLEGILPYTAVWDNKPPGIYIIFSIALAVLGDSVFSVRIFACVFVVIACLFLYLLGNLIERNGQKTGLLAGIFYALATLNNGGIASNTDIFYLPFVLASVYFFFTNDFYTKPLSSKASLTFFSIGLLLGIGFEIKYVVLFDFLTLFLIAVSTFILKVKSNYKYSSILKAVLSLTLGFILPFIMVSLYYWSSGHWDDYIYANFTANKLRTIENEFSWAVPLTAILEQIRSNLIFWLSVPSAVIYLVISKNMVLRDRWFLSSLIAWFFIILLCIGTVLRGFLYAHYFLQLTPALCLITAYMAVRLVFPSSRIQLGSIKCYVALGIILAIVGYTQAFDDLILSAKYVYFSQVKGIENWQDRSTAIAEYLKPKVKPDDYIYVVDDEPIIYFLTDAQIPTPYAFPPFLVRRVDLPNITGVQPLAELDRILAKQPVYLVKRQSEENQFYVEDNKIFFDKLDQAIRKDYQLEKSIDQVNLYRLKAKDLRAKN